MGFQVNTDTASLAAQQDPGTVSTWLTENSARLVLGRDLLAAAESRARDLGIAVETADLPRNRILHEATVSVLFHAGVQPPLNRRLHG